MSPLSFHQACRIGCRVASVKQSEKHRTAALLRGFRQGTFQPLPWLLTVIGRRAAR